MIETYLKAIEGRPEFRLLDKGDYLVIDYEYVDNHSFDDPFRLDCRGIKFRSDGTLLARPLHKFFNLGEKGTIFEPERPHTFTTKLDGSMIHPALIKGELVLMTRKGITDVAEKAWEAVTPEIKDYMYRAVNLGFTPVFEYTSPINQIVISYSEPQLNLLAVRHNQSGTYVGPENLYLAGVPIVEQHGPKDFNFIEEIRGMQGVEGFVIQYHDGGFLKIKCDEYVALHRALDAVASTKHRLEAIATGSIDDIKVRLSPAILKEVEEMEDNFWARYQTYKTNVDALVRDHGHLDRRTFAVDHALKLDPPWLKGAAFTALDGKDNSQLLKELIIKNWS